MRYIAVASPSTVGLVATIISVMPSADIRESRNVLANYTGSEVELKAIVNHFFGESVTVAGLLTGKDLAEQLEGVDLGDELLLSSSTLRADGDLFLCGMTPEELSARLGVKLTFSGCDGGELLDAILGIHS